MQITGSVRSSTLATLAMSVLLLISALTPLNAQVPGECTAPAAGRTKELGCYLVAEAQLEAIPRHPYWHIVRYPDLASARADQRPAETVVTSLGQIWLYAIAARDWKPKRGVVTAIIGPLPLPRASRFTARYLEGVSTAGMESTVHRHSGPEAWFMISGTQCLETSKGVTIIRQGHSGIVPAGPAMRLSTLGSGKRQALVLVLHDSSKPWMTMAMDWKPQDRCSRRGT